MKYIGLTASVFGLTSIIYGWMTGNSFFFRGNIIPPLLFDTLMCVLVLWFSFQSSKIYLSIESEASSSLSLVVSLLLVISVHFFILWLIIIINDDAGEIFRFYVSSISLLIMFLASLLMQISHDKRSLKMITPNDALLRLIFMLSGFVLSFLIYTVKGTISNENLNFTYQMFMCLTGIVLPLIFVLSFFVNLYEYLKSRKTLR